MPTINILDESAVSFTGGVNLGGSGAQGGGNHLAGSTMTLSSNALTSIEVTDNNDSFQDDAGSNQTITSGPDAGTEIEAEFFIVVEDPDGNTYTLLAVSTGHPDIIGLTVVGDTLPPVGVDLTVIDNGEPGGTSYDDLVPLCFTPGSMIRTPGGLRAVETLQIGDEVITRDNGVQVLRWTSNSTLSAQYLRANPELAPVRIAAGSIAENVPAQDLVVSPCHRVLLSGWKAEALFGDREVLVTARSMINDATVRPVGTLQDAEYVHLMFDGHEIVESDGLATESYRPFEGAVDSLSAATQDELFRIMPQLRTGGDYAPARRLLKDSESLALRTN